MRRMSPKFLLSIHFSPLHASGVSSNTGLPCRRSQVPKTSRCRIIKDFFDFFKWLLTRLREKEQDVDEHGETEDAEHDVDFPADVGEGRWDEVGECEVEDPVCGRG